MKDVLRLLCGYMKRENDKNPRRCCPSISTAHHGGLLCSLSPTPSFLFHSTSLSQTQQHQNISCSDEVESHCKCNPFTFCHPKSQPNTAKTCFRKPCLYDYESPSSIPAFATLVSALNGQERGEKQGWWRVCVSEEKKCSLNSRDYILLGKCQGG